MLKYVLPAAAALIVLIVRAWRRDSRFMALGVIAVSFLWGVQSSLGIADSRAALIAFLHGFFWSSVVAHVVSLVVQHVYGRRT